MALAYAHWSAGENDQLGIDGSFAEHKWVSVIDADNDDPLTEVIQHNPIGNPHPFADRFPGVVVRNWRKGEKLNNRTWYCYVLFGHLTDETIGLWARSGRPANEQINMPYAYDVLDDNGNVILTQDSETGNVAPLAYPAAAPVFVEDKQGIFGANGITGALILKKTQMFDAVELTDVLTLTALTYTITLPQIASSVLRAARALCNRCNKDVWLDYPKWELLLTHCAFEDFVMVVPGGTVAQWFTRFTVDLIHKPSDPLHAPFGWRAKRVVATYKEHGGLSSSPVFDRDGRVVHGNLGIKREVDLDEWFRLIGGGAVPNA